MVCWDVQKRNRTLKALTDWLFQQNSAALQADDKLSLIRGALLYMVIICMCVYADMEVCVCASNSV